MLTVVDSSITLAFLIESEESALADAAIRIVETEGGIAPTLWWYEVRNGLIMCERRGRRTHEDTRCAIADLAMINVAIDPSHDEKLLLSLARRHGLTIYDTAYLELAKRRHAALATLGKRLRKAAADEGIPVFAG